MSALPFRRQERVNLSTAEVLIVGGDADGVEILAQMFAGFGVHTPRRCSSGAEGMTVVGERDLNLVVVDSALEDTDGYDFIKWLRRCGSPNAWAPTILVTGHTTPSQIFRGRDAGASFVVRKPVPPLVMMQRIVWVLKDERRFVESPGYCGPDRRFRAMGPPIGSKGRRHDDLSAEVGIAKTPNLDQSDIDAMFQPKAVAR
ncbi:MAG: response regulator [Phenylobacterium sp.]